MTREFACRRCGNCCRVQGYVRLRQDEPEALAAALGMTIEDFTERYTRLTADRRGLSLTETPDHACSLLDPDGTCRVHNVKPRQCREFPWAWSYDGYEEMCQAMRESNEI